MYVADTVRLNDIEIWKLINTTLIAHPFHIHDVSFDVLDINGKKPSVYERGKKDMVLVMPGDTVRFITRFDDFADATVPYMYHCHLLHHEDDGMMASFIVVAANTAIPGVGSANGQVFIFPNPAHNNVNIRIADWKGGEQATLAITDFLGRKVYETIITHSQVSIPTDGFAIGLYHVSVSNNRFHSVSKLSIQ
ncbi:MAG: multicopper oxidase domain-containing protein, partial [Chitinophagaceae bacterium]